LSAYGRQNPVDSTPSLNGKSFEVSFIQVDNADIHTSRKIMSQYAEDARPSAAEKQKPALLSTVLRFDKGRFYSGILPPKDQGCLYKVNTADKKLLSFDATCMVYAAYFASGQTTYSENQKTNTGDMDAPANTPVATWGGTVKGNSIEGIVAWTAANGKRIYYYYSGNAK
jgi:hypothetical protein